ncbi:MAG TPA: BatA and WFA domain-containing protein [Polyangiaceae bacterium]|nr:BatA and WFA domain-containing protein [Polyangiaceae bacterium]
MAFLTTLALGVALFVAAPYLAHRLRRLQAQELPFPPARLVVPSPEKARRRARLEDRALLATRVLAVIGLAVLGATPFVHCSRLSLQRSGGASVAIAIVVDDSMSMRAGTADGTRFERARKGARELLASMREGDAVGLVLAGAPARIALAATTDLSAARDAINAMTPSDRATDLDGAVGLARGLLASLPQVDRRLVVLSDLADGHHDGPPLGGSSDVPLWVALPELAGDAGDCAVMRADRRGARVRVAVACGPEKSAVGREVTVEDADGKVLGRAPVQTQAGPEVTVLLPTEDAKPVRARLGGSDAIAADDVVPVVLEAGRGAIAVVGDAAEEAVVTGGAPIVEQALSSLKLDIDVHPLPAMPDRVEDLDGALGVVLDDPAGLTPEQRHALSAYLDRGGEVLLALGPRAAIAPLGATLEPILTRPIAWSETSQAGVDVTNVLGPMAESAESLTQLAAPRRALIAPEDAAAFELLVKWGDGAPLVARRAMGRGGAWVVTLPFSVEASDLTLRPAFLSLLDAWAERARRHASPARSDVGTTWRFPGAHDVVATGPDGAAVPVEASSVEGGPAAALDGGGASPSMTPGLLGAYQVSVDGHVETRVAACVESELDLRPRPIAPRGAGVEAIGERRASVDASGDVALALLALMAIEMGLRLWTRRPLATRLADEA